MWIFLFILLLINPPRVSAAVVINEIFPKSADVSLTWIELYNSGPLSVSLDRWRLENGGQGSYILNAGAMIAPGGFLTLYQNQSGVTFSFEGDSVRLFDDKNNLIDSQSFPGILGYNTAMGRSSDGGTGWVICTPSPDYVATPNKPNKCPPPPTNTPTATAVPTNSPTRSATPSTISVAAFIPTTPSTTIDPSSRFAFPDVLGAATTTPTPTPADFRQSDTFKKIWLFSLIVGVGLGIVLLSVGLFKTLKR